MRHLPCRNYKRHRIVPESSSSTAHLRDLSRLVHCWVSPKVSDVLFTQLLVQ
jgi:hypothetical protein